MIRRILLSVVFAACTGALSAGSAVAQSYPDRFVKMIVPFPAGGRST